jgi:hypothetical protein
MVFHHVENKIASDKAGSSGYDYSHFRQTSPEKNFHPEYITSIFQGQSQSASGDGIGKRRPESGKYFLKKRRRQAREDRIIQNVRKYVLAFYFLL